MADGIGIWMPTYGQTMCWEIGHQYVRDIAAATAAGHRTAVWNTTSSFLAMARNRAVRDAIEKGLRYLMMQDSDIYCPDGQMSPLEHMLCTMGYTGAAVVGAICGLRRIDVSFVAPNVRPFHKGKIYQGDRVGTGMVLIDLDVIRKIRETYQGPLFACTYKDESQTQMDFGEDFFFCRVLVAHGAKIWINGIIPTVHAYTDRAHLAYDGKADGDDGQTSEE